MQRTLLIAFLLVSFILHATSPALAAFGTNTITISKTVLDPQKNTYTHNLGLTDSMYNPGDIVTFHITVANTGNTQIPEVQVKDTLPSTITLTSGSVDFVAKELTPHTTQTFTITAKIAEASDLPTNQGIVCTANKVSAKAPSTQTVQDTSSFCIQKTEGKAKQPVYQSAQTKTTPATGPEALPLLGLFGTGIIGVLLRKKTKVI
jgi:uncharacterized repeat protein (TIGR01451 family)